MQTHALCFHDCAVLRNEVQALTFRLFEGVNIQSRGIPTAFMHRRMQQDAPGSSGQIRFQLSNRRITGHSAFVLLKT